MPVSAIVDLEADVLPFLQFSEMPADGGAKLQQYIDGLTPVIEDMVGHVVEFDIAAELHDGGDQCIFLRETPILAVTSMVEVIGLIPYTLTNQPVGSPVDNFGYSIDNVFSGKITRRSAGSQAFEFYENTANITVEYSAGRASVPPNVKMAMLELIKARYVPEQEAFGPASTFVPNISHDDASEDPQEMTPSGFLVPRAVYQLCQATPRAITIA